MTQEKSIADSATDTVTTVAEVAIGAAQTAAEVASDPIGSARKQVKGLERKGTPTARKVNRRVQARIDAATAPARDAAKTLNTRFNRAAKRAEEVRVQLNPERIMVKGLHLVKVQAKRQDFVGDVAKGALNLFNDSFKTIARTATRLEKASDLNPTAHRPAQPAARVARPAARASRSTRARARRRPAARRRAA